MSAADQLEQKFPGLLDATRTVESGGNNGAVSKKGALGPYQLMPETAAHYRVDPFNPVQAREAAAQNILEGLQWSGGDIDKAMRYYQGGPNTAKWGRENAEYPGLVLAALPKRQDGQGASSPAPQPSADPFEAAMTGSPGKSPAPVSGGSTDPFEAAMVGDIKSNGGLSAPGPQETVGGNAPQHPLSNMAPVQGGTPPRALQPQAGGVVDPAYPVAMGPGGPAVGPGANAAASDNGGTGTAIVQGLNDALWGAVGGVDKVAGTVEKGGAWALDKLGFKPDQNLSSLVAGKPTTYADLADKDNQAAQDYFHSKQFTPDGWASTAGDIGGLVGGTLPVAGIKLFRAAEEAPALVRALAKYGNYAVQGGAAGVATSDGKDVADNAIMGAALGPVGGAIGEKVVAPIVERVGKPLMDKVASPMVQALRRAASPPEVDAGEAAFRASRAGAGEPGVRPAPTMTADEAYASRPAQTISRPGETVDQYRARRAAEFDAAQAKADEDARASMAAGGPLEVGVVGGRDDYVNGVGDPNAPKGQPTSSLASGGTEADGTPIIQLNTPKPSSGNNAALVNGLKNAGAGRGIESVRDLPTSVADDIAAARRSGVPDDHAQREADVRYIGGEPTIGSTTRDPTAQRLEKVNANLDTPDGAALAQRAADNNAALHNTVQSSIEGYGGVPAQGEVSQTVAHSLANASDAEYAKVSALYKQGDEEAAAQAGSSDAATAQRQAEANAQAASDAQAAARKELDEAQAAHKAAKADPNADPEKTERDLIFARDALREATARPPRAPAVPTRTGAGYIDISPLRQALDAPEMKNATIEGLNTLANGTRGYIDALSNGTNRVSASEAESIRQAINDAYDIRGGAINGHVGRLKDMLDQSMDAATDAPASYRDARSAYKAWASKYQDPEGVANIIRRDLKGNFLNEDKWRSTDNGLIGTTNEQAFHQVTRRLLANRDVDTLNRMKAELVHRPYEAASKGAGDQNNHAVFSPQRWRDTINSIGMNKYRALFGKDEVAHLATIYRAAQALHEPVPGVVNGSNTGTTLINAAGMADALRKVASAQANGGNAALVRGTRALHMVAPALHAVPLAGAAAHMAIEGAAGAVSRRGVQKATTSANAELAAAIRRTLNPTETRHAASQTAASLARQAARKRLAAAVGRHAAPATSATGTGKNGH